MSYVIYSHLKILFNKAIGKRLCIKKCENENENVSVVQRVVEVFLWKFFLNLQQRQSFAKKVLS